MEHSYQESYNLGDSTGGKHPFWLTNEHTQIIKIYFTDPLDYYYIMGYITDICKQTMKEV